MTLKAQSALFAWGVNKCVTTFLPGPRGLSSFKLLEHPECHTLASTPVTFHPSVLHSVAVTLPAPVHQPGGNYNYQCVQLCDKHYNKIPKEKDSITWCGDPCLESQHLGH